MSIENNKNNLISSFFKYKNGEKIEINNINLPDSETPGYFLAQDANDIAQYINTIIQGISNSDSLHLSGLLLNEYPKLQVKVKNDSILIDSTGIYVNENNHRFLCNTLINNSPFFNIAWSYQADNDTYDHNINEDLPKAGFDNEGRLTANFNKDDDAIVMDLKTVESYIANGFSYNSYSINENDNSSKIIQTDFPASVNLQYNDTSGLHVPIDNNVFKFMNKTTGLQLKIDNTTILTGETAGLYVPTDNKTIKVGDSGLNVSIDNKTILTDETSGLYVPIDNKTIKVGDSGLNVPFNADEFNITGNVISLSDKIQTTLQKAENMPEYLSPTNSHVFILVDENFILTGDHVVDPNGNQWRL